MSVGVVTYRAGTITSRSTPDSAPQASPARPCIWRTFAWTEFYFVITITVDLVTGANYGYLLHRPEAASLLNLLSDSRPLYLFEMHLLALFFFLALYSPFAIYDLARGKVIRNAGTQETEG